MENHMKGTELNELSYAEQPCKQPPQDASVGPLSQSQLHHLHK